MEAPGRNDRCPCGSGKKYKVCCLDRAPLDGSGHDHPEPAPELDEATLAAFKLRADTMDHLVGFAEGRYRRLFKEARDFFPRLDDVDEDEEREILPLDEDEERDWEEWMLNGVLFDLPAGPDGEVIAEVFLRKVAGRLSESERQWIRQMLEAPLNPFAVEDFREGESVRLRNLWTNEERACIDPYLSGWLPAGSILAARLTGEPGASVIEPGLYTFPPDRFEEMQEAMAAYLEHCGVAAASELTLAQRRMFSVVIHDLWTELAREDGDLDQDAPAEGDDPRPPRE